MIFINIVIVGIESLLVEIVLQRLSTKRSENELWYTRRGFFSMISSKVSETSNKKYRFSKFNELFSCKSAVNVVESKQQHPSRRNKKVFKF